MRPDPSFVRDFLETVGRQRGSQDDAFTRHVLLRLAHGDREYGDEGARPLGYFLRELREEAADIPGWAVMTTDSVFREEADGSILDADFAHLLRLKTISWAAVGQYLWRDMTDTLDELDERSALARAAARRTPS